MMHLVNENCDHVMPALFIQNADKRQVTHIKMKKKKHQTDANSNSPEVVPLGKMWKCF